MVNGGVVWVTLPGSSLVPVVQVKTVDGVRAGVRVLLPRPHWVLVHGGVGLSRRVVARRQAGARLTAVVTVPVVHGAVLVIESCKGTKKCRPRVNLKNISVLFSSKNVIKCQDLLIFLVVSESK